MNATPHKLLVVGPTWVGDMVMSQVLYRFLRQRYPDLIIDVLAPTWSGPILERMPEVRRMIPLPLGRGDVSLGARRQLGKSLRPEQYDWAILLPNSFKSALVPYFARIPRRTGWRGELRYGLLTDLRKLDEQALPLMIQRFAALGLDAGTSLPESLPVPQLVVDPGQAAACREKFSIHSEKPLLALCPGAEFGGAKRWPQEYYAELAQDYLDRGWQVALFGSDNDKPVTSAIYSACGKHRHCIDLAGRTELAEAVDMLSLSDAVVSNDSGLMHIAAALSRPLVVVYGATSPRFTPPLNDNADMLVSDIDCAPCFQRECPLGHHRCMRDTLPVHVAGKLDALLTGIEGA